jgi:indole-3-pyruvate monooxygenase
MTTKSPTVVIGAGPAGLAVSACLHRHGVEHFVLEQGDTVAPRWHNHYDRLHLHTFRGLSNLPHKRFDRGTPIYPSRQDVVDYLDAYAAELGVEPLFGQQVKRVKQSNGKWRVETQNREFEAQSVVIATGYNGTPYEPTWPGQEAFQGQVFHARQYRNGSPWKGKRALVVGAGNTGAEIAIDLFEHGAQSAICIRGPIHVVPRDVNGIIPAQILGQVFSRLPLPVADRLGLLTSKLTFGDLSDCGIERPQIGPISQIKKYGRIPLIDIGTIGHIRQGNIRVVPGIETFTENGCVFVDGTELPFDVVVLATGYRPSVDAFLDDASRYLNKRGYPIALGAKAKHPGPYFVGFGNPPTGQIFEINLHGRAVAAKIAKAQRGKALS